MTLGRFKKVIISSKINNEIIVSHHFPVNSEREKKNLKFMGSNLNALH